MCHLTMLSSLQRVTWEIEQTKLQSALSECKFNDYYHNKCECCSYAEPLEPDRVDTTFFLSVHLFVQSFHALGFIDFSLLSHNCSPFLNWYRMRDSNPQGTLGTTRRRSPRHVYCGVSPQRIQVPHCLPGSVLACICKRQAAHISGV